MRLYFAGYLPFSYHSMVRKIAKLKFFSRLSVPKRRLAGFRNLILFLTYAETYVRKLFYGKNVSRVLLPVVTVFASTFSLGVESSHIGSPVFLVEGLKGP